MVTNVSGCSSFARTPSLGLAISIAAAPSLLARRAGASSSHTEIATPRVSRALCLYASCLVVESIKHTRASEHGQATRRFRRVVESDSRAQFSVETLILRARPRIFRREDAETISAKRAVPRVAPALGCFHSKLSPRRERKARSTRREKTFGTHEHAPQEPPRAETISRRETLGLRRLRPSHLDRTRS